MDAWKYLLLTSVVIAFEFNSSRDFNSNNCCPSTSDYIPRISRTVTVTEKSPRSTKKYEAESKLSTGALNNTLLPANRRLRDVQARLQRSVSFRTFTFFHDFSKTN